MDAIQQQQQRRRRGRRRRGIDGVGSGGHAAAAKEVPAAPTPPSRAKTTAPPSSDLVQPRQAPDDDARMHRLPPTVTRARFIESFRDNPLTKFYPFEDNRGQRRCWHLGRQSADEFAATSGVVVTDELFHGRAPTIKVFYPINNTYYVVTPVRLRGKSTVPRVLQAIEAAAENGYAYHIANYMSGNDVATVGRIRRMMAKDVVCHLMIRRAGGGNHVYVRMVQ